MVCHRRFLVKVIQLGVYYFDTLFPFFEIGQSFSLFCLVWTLQ